jgi:cell division septum initiation protein DivIVA
MSHHQQAFENHGILDTVFYQPDLNGFNHNQVESMTAKVQTHNQIVAQLKKDLQTNQDTVKAATYKTSVAEWVGGYGTLLATAGICSSMASHFFIHDHLRLFMTIISGLGGFVISFHPAVWVASYIEKLKIKRWKKSPNGQKILHIIASLEQEIEQREKQMNETITNKVTKDYFFQGLSQLDALIAHIKSLYSDHFLNHYVKDNLNYGQNLDIESLRTNFIDYYMNGHHRHLVDMVETMDNIRISFEKAWQDYTATDKHHLMTEYQDYVKNGGHHIQNIL